MGGCPPPATIQKFILDELDAVSGADVELHLGHCLNCQKLADGFSDDPALRDNHEQYLRRSGQTNVEIWRDHLQRWYAATSSGGLSSSGVRSIVLPPREKLGRFRIDRLLGRGGFGVVYLAKDPKLRRQVALKVPHGQSLAAPASKKRFMREARAAAALNHPNIVTVFETDEADDTCYLISAYCRGGTLAEHLEDSGAPLSPRQAATLIAILADAVHYAHQCGVLHCDLKPGNVMLEPADESSPGAPNPLPFVPLLTDFGLARFVEQPFDESTDAQQSDESTSRATMALGQSAGTPGYMAPEQVDTQQGAIGRSTDVYGLGAILYELLTGQTPFTGNNRRELLERMLTEEVPAPRQIRASIPRDLEAICRKCLSKSPHGRYLTAAELADDLRRFLRDEPTQARPLAPPQRFVRWTRRNPATAGILATLLMTTVGVLLGLTIYTYKLEAIATALQASWARELQEKSRAEQGELLARRQAYVSETWRAWQMHRDGQGSAICRLLNQQRPVSSKQEDLRGFEWFYLWNLGTNLTDLYSEKMGGGVETLCFSFDGKYMATSHDPINAPYTVSIWDVPTRSLIRTVPGGELCEARFSLDGRRLFVAFAEGRIDMCDVETGRVTSLPGPVFDFATFSPDASLLAFEVKDQARRVLRLWSVHEKSLRPLSTRYEVCFQGQMHFSIDSKRLSFGRHAAETGEHVYISVIDTATGALLSHFPYGTCVHTISCDENESTMLIGTRSGQVSLVHLNGHRPQMMQVAHHDFSVHTAISPNGQSTAFGIVKRPDRETEDSFHDVHLKRTNDLQNTVRQISILGESLQALEFSRDGKLLALGARNGLLRLARVELEEEFEVWQTDHLENWCTAVSPDNKLLLTAGDDHLAQIWNLQTGKTKLKLEGHTALVTCATFSRRGESVVTGSFDGTAIRWDGQSGTRQQTFSGHQGPIRCLAISNDEKLLATAGDDQEIKLWNLENGELAKTLIGHQDKVRSVFFHPNNHTLLSAGNDGAVSAWDLRHFTVQKRWLDTNQIHALSLAKDGRKFAIGNKEGIIRLYDFDSDRSTISIAAHAGEVRALEFSYDGRTLASGGADSVVKLWRVATGEELLKLPGTQSFINDFDFASDDSLLTAACHDGTVVVWRAPRD